jgi:hypothetical protein
MVSCAKKIKNQLFIGFDFVDLALEYFRSYSTFEESFGYDNFSLEDLC